MSSADASRPNRVAVAVLHSDPPQVFLAESEETLSRLVALEVVAHTNPSDIGSEDYLDDIREALLSEEWARAVELWLLATDEVLDAYASEEVVWGDVLDDERASMEIRLAPIFEESDDGAGP